MPALPKRLVAGSQIATSATTYYTATNCSARIDACSLINTTAGAIVVSLYLVPSGGAADATTCVLSDKSIAADQTYVVQGAIGHWLESGGTIRAIAGSATSVTLIASGVEYT